ncbi:MAG TPA: DUF1565 domain-containing protein [Xenococcaceae cyanobacterium]
MSYRVWQHQNQKNQPVRGSIGIRSWLIAAMIPLSLGSISIYPNSAKAQQTEAQNPITAQTIYVDPNRGDDTAAASQVAPLKTITQALQIAQPNTTIALAPGTYSEATGEVFPLIIKTNITLQGTPGGKGHNTIIQGGGSFISPTGAGQNVTIAAIKDAGAITGVTVTNPHNRGHGLWIESANPQVTHNTFTRNGNTGLSVNGKSNPVIADNYFYLNLGNGLLIYGTSQPQVSNNDFEKTGFGVSVVQNAAPTLIGNRFSGNRIGIILEGNTQGILRQNQITNSSEYGLVAISQSRADLGTTTEPGENTFYNNGKFDIQNISSTPISAVGTEVAGQIEGNIDFSGATVSPVVHNNEVATATANPTSDRFSRLRQFPLTETPKQVETAQPETNPISSSALGSGETLPPPPTITNPAENNPTTKELVFAAPSEEVYRENSPLAVPHTEPPASAIPNAGSNRQIGSLSDLLATSNNNSSNVQYRVLVEVANNNQKTQVKSLYPEAFSTVYQSKSMLQVGAFSDRTKAETASRSLADLGLNSYVLDF